MILGEGARVSGQPVGLGSLQAHRAEVVTELPRRRRVTSCRRPEMFRACPASPASFFLDV